jgi:hypothetical protein
MLETRRFLLKFIFTSLVFVSFPFVVAQTFQAPTNNTYTCFSGEDFITATEQIGTLIVSAQSYTFTVGTQSETGTVIARDESVTDTFNFATAGSSLVLTSQNGNENIGFYLLDNVGGSYIIIATGNTFIRCEAPGSDFAAAASGKNASPPQTTTLANGEGILLEPALLPSVVAGTYQCFYITNSSSDEIEDTDEVITSVQLFDNGEFKDNNPDYSSEATGHYVFDGQELQLPEAGGYIGDGTIFKYGLAGGLPSFVWHEEGNTYQSAVSCNRISDVTDVPPSVAATEDYNLEPATTKAAAPPPGSGGLSGFFVNTKFESDTVTSTGADGFPVSYPSTTQVDTELFFFLDGYVFEGAYAWGYSELGLLEGL